MFVVNFDFSQSSFIGKLLKINIPIFITELAAYPLQRIQTLLVSQQHYITKNQFQQAQLIFKEMVSKEKYPKLLHGLRYTLDYNCTSMTAKFLLFDFLFKEGQNIEKWKIYVGCASSNVIAACLAQSAFNYQILASSLPVNPNNRNENVWIKIKDFTKKNNPFKLGLKYSVPIAAINSILELGIINSLNTFAKQQSQSQFLTIIALLATSLPVHYTFQRQTQLVLSLNYRLPFTKGLLGTFLRHNIKFFTLYCMYYSYSQFEISSQISSQEQKRQLHQSVQGTRK